jgi:hypothetical protein
MAENKNLCGTSASSMDTVCIACNRILDSCRDKDCFENTRVFLTDFGEEIIEKTSNIRVKSANVVWTSLQVEPVQFNRGFYQIYIRFHVKVILEACLCPGKVQELEGIAVCEKKVILYGSEGNVNIFKSDPNNSDLCSIPCGETHMNNLPIAVCEVIDPICLNTRIVSEPQCDPCCNCCCCADDIPDHVCSCINGNLVGTYSETNGKKLYISLGFFSVVRIERPGQFLVKATEYSVPDKECVVNDGDDPCALFKSMTFPTSEFSSPSYREINNGTGNTTSTICECDRNRR